MLLETIHSICTRTPSRLAVVAGADRLTYGELEQQAYRLAQLLVKAEISKGSVVAIYARRTVEAFACLLGVMRSGAAYTVVENDGNHAENHNRLTSINADIILCERDQLAALTEAGFRAIVIDTAAHTGDDRPLPNVAATDIAYVLFTSGSTGKPKGVAVSHGNVAHYTSSIEALLEVEPGLKYAHVSTLAADLGNTSLFLSLATGGCLHLIDTEMRKDPVALRDYLIDQQIQFLKITPSHWNAIFTSVAENSPLQLEYLVLGGEVMPVKLAKKILERGVTKVLVNHYGPTETTIGVTANPIRDIRQLDALESDSVPIGRPFGQTQLRVRGDDGRFFEKDAKGELYIGGPSVSAGYVGDPATTEKAFVSIDAGSGRFYKTGDYVSIDEAGVVSFLGRVDRQVKVNGYRVELEHIESVLRTVPGVDEAAVYFLEVRGKNRIVAAVLSHNHEGSFDWLKQPLAGLLPEYMIPKVFLQMAEFPRNDNGKTNLKLLREDVLVRLNDEPSREYKGAVSNSADSKLVEEIRELWFLSLRDGSFGNEDNFFDVGGDSLDAIQLIAGLQVKGYQVTAHAFLKNPTVSGLVKAIGESANAAKQAGERTLATESRNFSPAQDFFFNQQLAEPDHYNQAVLLECGVDIDVEVMRKVVTQLMTQHHSLRMAYGQDAQGGYARLVERSGEHALGVSFIHESAQDGSVEEQIERISQGVQKSLSLAEGNLFRVQLFKFESAPDHILLVAHHIAVDVISWRILISELVRLYCDYSAGAEVVLPANRNTFWGWVDHIDEYKETLYKNAASWLGDATEKAQRFSPSLDSTNTEGAAKTLWLGFSADETRKLSRDLVTVMGAPIHLIVLATFAYCVARRRSLKEVAIDVESHGRVTFDDSIDVSRVVGWHTSTFPMFVEVDKHSINGTINALVAQMQDIPDLGAAYGVLEKSKGASVPSAAICYNYLGEFNFGHDERFGLAPSRYSIGHARGEHNNRGHELKLTARVVDGHLVADLSVPGSASLLEMTEVMHDLRNELLGLLGISPSVPQILTESGTRTGLISYVPKQLIIGASAEQRREYEAVLLTGATGYVGVHALKELFYQSRTHVYCIVRGKEGVSAQQRLQESFDSYFPETLLSTFEGRYTVIDGDVSQRRLGLSEELYDQLSAKVDAVYHFAADTRLFGPEEEFHRNNVVPVQDCIDFAKTKRPKDLHYMSTLAVSGVNSKATPLDFTEDSMDVGQEFQNYYERTKYLAECLVKNFEVAGCRGFIYRSGNVSGNSQTARFQRNARDNRFIQFLSACVKLGKLPQRLGEPIVLSPIDEVAAGIVAISLDANSKGGVFHVDSSYETSLDRVFDALRNNGFDFEQTEHETFASLFSAIRDHKDPDLALGYFWATRKPRNVRFNHERTHQALRRLGCSFTEVSDDWLTNFFHSLTCEGVFGSSVLPREMDFAMRRTSEMQIGI